MHPRECRQALCDRARQQGDHAPVIREAITGGSGVISGSFHVRRRGDLALLLRAGALPAPITILEERTVVPSSGPIRSMPARSPALSGSSSSSSFMVLFYGLFGIFADVALLFNLCLMLGSLSLLGAP